jgi:hypothetical protein
MRFAGELLASVTSFDNGFAILHRYEPVETSPKGFAEKSSTDSVVPTGSLMDVA